MDRSWFYTNSFAVKSRAAFESFCRERELRLFEEGGRIGCFHPGLGLPQILEDARNEEMFLHKRAADVQERFIAVVDASITERDHCDGSWQVTYAINARGEVNSHAVFALAWTLGTHISPLQDMDLPVEEELR